MIVEKEDLMVCFVNTTQSPVKIRRMGFFSVNIQQKVVNELCEVFYPHPETPNILVSVVRFLECEPLAVGFLSSISFIYQAMMGIKSQTKLKYYDDIVENR